MSCASCGRSNRDSARFCGGCGASLAPRCPACGAEAEAGAQFCDACGAPLTARPAEAAVARKVVTIVFADLVGSTALHERLDAESARLFMERYYRAMRAAVESFGGTVTQLLGDGVKAVFGAPRVAEDDAIRAVRAAVEMQRAFRELADEQSGAVGQTGLRVAVNTGEVVATDDTEIIGDPVNVAARLQEEARDGGVVIGESTRRLVADLVTLAPLGTFALKGRAETVAAYCVVSLERPAGAAAIAFVGRDDELARLHAVYDAAVEKPAAHLAVLLGSPGLGKSRLLAEFARRLGDRATVLIAQCGAAGATFAPLADALRAHFHIEAGGSGGALRAAIDAVVPGEAAERARIAAGIGALLAGTPASPEETFFVVRRLLTALAAKQPVVLAIDDLQWAEPLLLDLTEHLVQWGAGVPLLVLAAARPELRDARSSLASHGGVVSDVVTLGGLDAGAATQLAANVIGADALPAALAGRVLAASEGNPLFLGELVRMLVHDGALKREGDRWTAGVELAALEMPPTIQALLAARIERLRPEERLVLERAAVVGRHFSRTAIVQLLPREAHSDLDARLESLRRSELIESDTGWLLGEPALRFHHVLIRDAAYRRLLKNTRAELHARFADWVEARGGEAVEHDETIGWHLEQAHQHLGELGPIDARGRALGERAARHLAAAGRRALARDDVPLAASLLGRALARLDAGDRARADLALDWCEALLSAGDVGAAAAAIDELGRFIDGEDRLRAWHTCFAGQLAALTNPQALRATADAVAAAAEVLTSAGDAAGEAKAHSVHAIALARLGKVGACEAALDRALAAARRAHDRRRANGVLAGAPLAALWGPSPVTRASGRCLDVVRVLRITQGAPAVEAIALQCQGVLEALRGRTEAARRMIASSRQMVEELGITHRLLDADVFAGRIELLEDDAAAAERCLRSAYDGLRGLGLGIDAARAAALLARALLALDRAAEAEALSHESEALAGDDLQAAIAWRGVRAEALARRGEHAAAVEFARKAVEIAAATDALLDHADARLALAAALRAAGRGPEADAEEARAIELWDAKGATLLVERVRHDGGRAPSPAREGVERVEPERPIRRTIQPNAATAYAARVDSAFAARDVDLLAGLLSDDYETLDHPSGAAYDRDAEVSSHRALLRARDSTYQHEPLATLGDSLALCRSSVFARGLRRGDIDMGAWERPRVELIEVDAQGCARRTESFAPDHMGDAAVQLYRRYAELLPDGTERERAAATARSVAALLGQPDCWLLAPDAEAIDHRTVGFGSLHGADAVVRAIRSLLQLSDGFDTRIDDVLALRSDALFVRWTTSGTIRASGGTFERSLRQLFFFGTDGQVTRWEQFDAEQDTEALARFDELTAAAKPPPRRVRANAATAYAAREDAAFAARDGDAIADLWADDLEVVDHPNGATYGMPENLTSMRRQLRAQDLKRRNEPLATLGDALALCRMSLSSAGIARGSFDIGAYAYEGVNLFEVDAQGRCRRTECFAGDHLGDAVVRLYERYAELLPDGAERDRATATARSVAALPLAGPIDIDRWASVFAPDIEGVDPRTVGFGSLHGAEALLRAMRAFRELVEDPESHVEDVLDLRSDALLVRWSNSGTLGGGAGPFERTLLMLWTFGADGLLARWEQCDVDREAEALARFDELTAAAKPSPRRVRANAATAHAAREDAAFAARDADALATLFADELEVVDHPNGATHDKLEYLPSMRRLLRAQALARWHEPLATLGDALALCRMSLSSGGIARGNFDVGAYAYEGVNLFEVDAQGRCRRTEFFAGNHLGDAIARLYERYAELLPEGPARTRAAATARSAAAYLMQPWDPDRYAAAFAPAIEVVDHRILGTWSTRGVEAAVENIRSWLLLTDDGALREGDILRLQSDALLAYRTFFGTDRASGGSFEREFLQLWVFGSDGLLTRIEYFDVERYAEALARFDELTAEPAKPRPLRRRVRENAATASAARYDAAIAARDEAALADVYAEGAVSVHHATGTVYDRDAGLARSRAIFRAENTRFETQPLATLGDSLALGRTLMSAGGLASGRFDVGAYEAEAILLTEVDANGRRVRLEHFEVDHLGDAVARLYERYADLLQDGAARERAATTARSVAGMLATPDLARRAAAFAPDIEFVDHRIVGVGSVRGANDVLRAIGALHDLVENVGTRLDDLIDMRADAIVLRWTHFGTTRDGGGRFERSLAHLWIFGANGRLTRWEQSEGERVDELLARFDELTVAPARPVRRVRANAATTHAARVDAAIADRDIDTLPALLADTSEVIDHTTGTTWDRPGFLATWHSLLSARDPTLRHDPLASLGDSLALCRVSTAASGFLGRTFDVGAYEREKIVLIEVDTQGRRRLSETFASDRLGNAVVRLYQRYAELLPDGPARTRAAATAHAVAAYVGPLDLDRYAETFAPAIEVIDHRMLGTWSARGAEALLEHFRSMLELADAAVQRHDDVLALHSNALLVRSTHSGIARAGGGAYERPYLMLNVFGGDGRTTRIEAFDIERDAEALARFDELTAEPPAARFANAASRAFEQSTRAIAQRDWGALVALYVPEHVFDDRRPLVRTRVAGEAYFANLRRMFHAWRDASDQLVATRGDRLSLHRHKLTSVSGDAGPAEFEMLNLIEVDASGRRAALVTFDPSDLDAAYAELDARYAAGEGAPHAATGEMSQGLGRIVASRDWERVAAVFTEEFVVEDHRMLGLGTVSRDEAVTLWRAMVDLAPDVRLFADHVLAINRRGALHALRWVGTRDGGAFEISFLTLWLLGPDGRIGRSHAYDLDQQDAARTCFDALTADPLRIPPNAATRVGDRWQQAIAAESWETVEALFAPALVFEDRRRGFLTTGDREMLVANDRVLASWRARFSRSVLATAGDRLALLRVLVAGTHEGGAVEGEFLQIIEVGGDGRLVAAIAFDPDDRRAASAEMYERFARSDASGNLPAGGIEYMRALRDRDLDRVRAQLPDDFFFHDHRRTGPGRLGSAEYVAFVAALFEQSPDVIIEGLYTVAVDAHGILDVGHLLGTRDGGDFESVFARIVLQQGGRVVGTELFEIEDLDTARVRFEELRPDLTRIPPNAAARECDRSAEAVDARDWDALRALVGDAFRFEDRSRWALVSGDVEVWIASATFLASESAARAARVLRATVGDRIALHQVTWRGGSDAARFELDKLRITEVDADGKLRAVVLFDGDDRSAAFAEAQARFATGEAAAIGGQAPIAALFRALGQHDWEALREALARDAAICDRRALAVMGDCDREQWIESLQTLADLAPDVGWELSRILAWNRHGRVGVGRRFGTARDGGPFEEDVVVVLLTGGDHVQRYEFFDVADADRALARFAELCAP